MFRCYFPAPRGERLDTLASSPSVRGFGNVTRWSQLIESLFQSLRSITATRTSTLAASMYTFSAWLTLMCAHLLWRSRIDVSDEFSFEHMLEFSKLAVAFAIELAGWKE